jgi:hypothetical protein
MEGRTPQPSTTPAQPPKEEKSEKVRQRGIAATQEGFHHRDHSAARWPQPKLAMIADCRLPIGD